MKYSLHYQLITCCKTYWRFTLCQIVLSADNICKQFGARSGYKLIDILKEFLQNVDFEKNSRRKKNKHKKLPSMQRVKGFLSKLQQPDL